MSESLKELSDKIYKENIEKGWYDSPREIGTLLMLIVSELSEALEADRKGMNANIEAFENPNGADYKTKFELYIKDTFEDEIADVLIRVLDLCGYLNIDIEKHMKLKLEYNKLRKYKHGNKKY